MGKDISAFLMDTKNWNQTTHSFKEGDYVDVLDTANYQLVFINSGTHDQNFRVTYADGNFPGNDKNGEKKQTPQPSKTAQ